MVPQILANHQRTGCCHFRDIVSTLGPGKNTLKFTFKYLYLKSDTVKRLNSSEIRFEFFNNVFVDYSKNKVFLLNGFHLVDSSQHRPHSEIRSYSC